MSRADLDAIQTKLKTAIQNHQMLVVKLKAEPQNASMKEKLHELQAEIMNLSKEQKVLVQELRHELMQGSKTSNSSASTADATTHTTSMPTASPIGQPRLLAIPTQGSTILPMGVVVPLAHVQARPALVTFPGVLNQPTDLTMSKEHLEQHHFLLSPTQTNSLSTTLNNNIVTTNNNIATKPVPNSLKQPQVTGRPIQPRRGSPPIKVPHYPINQQRPASHSGSHSQAQSGKQNSGQNNGFIHRSLSDSDGKELKKAESDVRDYRRAFEVRHLSSEERKKVEFMACLELVTPDTFKEMQNRRVERKRRSTANPQFSYSFDLERKRGNSLWLTGIQASLKRPRGRPPKPCHSPSNSRPGTPDSLSDRNGTSEADNHEDVCAECGKEGQLLMCSTCTLVYHLDCLSPPLATVPPGPWSCPGCIVKGTGILELSNGALTMVQSYITSKASKEEDKRKLERRNSDLQAERLELQERKKQLTEQMEEKKSRNQKLTEMMVEKEEQVDRLTSFIRTFQIPVHTPPTTA